MSKILAIRLCLIAVTVAPDTKFLKTNLVFLKEEKETFQKEARHLK